MGSCVAPGCVNFNSPSRNISYFHFPNPSKFPELHKAWLHAINKPDFKPLKHSCVCELHFTEDDYDDSYKMKKLLMPNDYFQAILKPGTVPKLQLQQISKEKFGEKSEILKELLGESYLRWKESFPHNLRIRMSSERSTRKAVRRVQAENLENIEEKKTFNLTTDYIMKRPLKPLPEALERVLPSLLSVIIRQDRSSSYLTKTSKGTKKENLTPKEFLCSKDIPIIYKCNICNFTTALKTHLFEHSRTAHRPINKANVFRLPMKICKLRKPKEYVCVSCDFFTFSKLVYLRHIYHKIERESLFPLIEIGWYRCEFCTYRTRQCIRLRKHKLDEHSEYMRIQEKKRMKSQRNCCC